MRKFLITLGILLILALASLGTRHMGGVYYDENKPQGRQYFSAICIVDDARFGLDYRQREQYCNCVLNTLDEGGFSDAEIRAYGVLIHRGEYSKLADTYDQQKRVTDFLDARDIDTKCDPLRAG